MKTFSANTQLRGLCKASPLVSILPSPQILAIATFYYIQYVLPQTYANRYTVFLPHYLCFVTNLELNRAGRLVPYDRILKENLT